MNISRALRYSRSMKSMIIYNKEKIEHMNKLPHCKIPSSLKVFNSLINEMESLFDHMAGGPVCSMFPLA